MPMYAVRCDNDHTGEVFRSVARRDEEDICPCGAYTHRVMAWNGAMVVDETPAYDDDLEPLSFKKRDRKEFLERAGSGKAALNKDTGGYRPACTHNTKCPKGHWANVAITADLPYGKRLNCDRCGYVWIYQASTAADPLLEGYNPAFTPAQRYGTGMKLGGERYEYGKRGA